MFEPRYIIVHHTAVSYRDNPDQFEQTNSYHQKVFDFLSSLGYYGGYTYEISSGGVVRQFRKEGEETAACIGHNKDSIHVCLDGNFDVEYPTKEQEEALGNLLVDILSRYKSIPYLGIIPHRKFANKSCYGNKLNDYWALLIALKYKALQLLQLTKK